MYTYLQDQVVYTLLEGREDWRFSFRGVLEGFFQRHGKAASRGFSLSRENMFETFIDGEKVTEGERERRRGQTHAAESFSRGRAMTKPKLLARAGNLPPSSWAGSSALPTCKASLRVRFP